MSANRRLRSTSAVAAGVGYFISLSRAVSFTFKQILRFFLKLKYFFKRLLKRKFRAQLSVLPLFIKRVKHRGARMGKGAGSAKVVLWRGRFGDTVFRLKAYSQVFLYRFILKTNAFTSKVFSFFCHSHYWVAAKFPNA